MMRFVFAFLAACWMLPAVAQPADSVFVQQGKSGWQIAYSPKKGETVFSIARRFHVPPAVLSDFNKLSYGQDLGAVAKIQIPVGAYNFKTAANAAYGARPIYFRAPKKVYLGELAGNSFVSTRQLQQWNEYYETEAPKGKTLLVGWLLYNAELTKAPVKDTNLVKKSKSGMAVSEESSFPVRKKPTETILAVIRPDSMKAAAEQEKSLGESLYAAQSNDDLNSVTDKGTAVFFKRAGQTSNGIYFAFHNTAKRGSILRVRNIGTGKTVYARVLGPLPKTALYYNAQVGLSSDARAALEVMDEKAWCEISYTP